jgi:peroxiredoxin
VGGEPGGGAPLFVERNFMKTGLVVLVIALMTVAPIARLEGAESDAASRARTIRAEIQGKQRAMNPYAFMDLVERLWGDFLKEYPNEPEAAEAYISLGFVYAQTGRHDKAIQHLEGYRNLDMQKNPNEEAKALVTLAGSYLALERFDEAEVLLKGLAERPSSGRDRRISQMAAQQLEMIGSLRKLKIGLPALAFTGTGPSGKEISLEDYRGKVVLIDFWASWCTPCRKEMPHVKKVYEKYNGNGFEIIGISLDDKKHNFSRYVQEEDLPWPQIFDGKGWQSEVGRLYAVSSIPATYLIDREGIIRYKNLRGNQLDDAVKELIGKK